MSDSRVIIIAAFGDRAACVERLVQNIRRFVDYPIIIVTTRDSNVGQTYCFGGVTRKYVDRRWAKNTHREGVRNSNYSKIGAALNLFDWNGGYESALLIDDDMFIVHEKFVDGFAIAEKFGAALPLNPRTFQLYNLMGADVSLEDCADAEGSPMFAPAHNFSPMFVSLRDERACSWLSKTRDILQDRTCRGTLAIWRAMWATGFTPVNLPMQWCVCGAEAQYIRDYTKRLKGRDITIPPIMLHLGHEETERVYRDIIDTIKNGETI